MQPGGDRRAPGWGPILEYALRSEGLPAPYFPKRLLISLHLMFSTNASRYFARAMP